MRNGTRKDRRLEREAYKAAGVCCICRKQDAEPDKTICSDCEAYLRKRAKREWRRLKSDKEAYREYKAKKNDDRRARYKFRKENGLCVQCGKPRNEDDVSRCGRCQEKQKLWQFINADRLKVVRDARRAKWHCNRCHKPMAHGEYKLCEDCRRYAREQYYKHKGE